MKIHEQLMQQMQAMAQRFDELQIPLRLPPPSIQTLGTEYIAMTEGEMLTARVPFADKFTNPLGMFQGGFLCAAIDDVFGPLSYMIAQRPAVTLEMSTSYIRPFTKEDEYVEIIGELVSKTHSLLILKAEIRNKNGKLLAVSRMHSLILNDDKLESRSAHANTQT